MTSIANVGSTQASRSLNQNSSYIPNSGISLGNGGGTYTSHHTEPSVEDFKNVFGPVAENIKDDLQRYKRHGRWHLPDVLQGPNPWLADRIDGLITDATNSPFTSTILPYRYFDNVDGKIKWNVWSFDEAMPSRVPYEAAARTLTQTKKSFSGYAVRHGLAITLEHNFMMTPKGRENFQNQLNQLVGSIQYANDLDVHMALIMAPSYEKTMLEKYNNNNKTPQQICREYVDLFGFMQKNQNGLDILIEEAKQKLKLWGGPTPNFMLTNSKLTFQIQMTPERTNYQTQGIDGVKRLRQGPDISSYRGLNIIPTRSFSMETGQPPRDMLRRRIRVAEYYYIKADLANRDRTFEFYNEDRDTFFSWDVWQLMRAAAAPTANRMPYDQSHNALHALFHFLRYSTKSGYDDAAGTVMQPPLPSGSKIGSNPTVKVPDDWNILFQKLQKDVHRTAKIRPQSLLAKFIDKDQIYVPFASNLHIDTEDTEKKWYTNLEKMVYPYPTEQHEIEQPRELRSPVTYQEVRQGTVEYYETRVLHARLHNRFASASSFLKVENGNLIFDNTTFQKQHLPVSDMIYQPLGAFHEPNHPLFTETTKSMHENWILTEDVLNILYDDQSRCKKVAEIAAGVNGTGLTKAAYSVAISNEIVKHFQNIHSDMANNLAVYTWSVTDNYLLSNDYLNPKSPLGKKYHSQLKQYAPNGIVTTEYLQKLSEMPQSTQDHPWMQTITEIPKNSSVQNAKLLKERLNADPYAVYKDNMDNSVAFERFSSQLATLDCTQSRFDTKDFHNAFTKSKTSEVSSLGALANKKDFQQVLNLVLGNVDFLIIRPNIEHYMLGIILGLSGDQLGNTLWGQTELSVYDDSQHGVWGMSYKYHERAIVFNEKNLIRLWDIAYDGYNGGKDDTYVDWYDDNDVRQFHMDTNDLTQDYHGKSMMVFALPYHENDNRPSSIPSPLLFNQNAQTMQLGSENEFLTEVKKFVFPLTITQEIVMRDIYNPLLPNFADLHQMRKSAPESTREHETQINCMAFQGTMRIKQKGMPIDVINGSGHHGTDYVGVASVRSGKGYKMNGGITNIVRQI